MHIAYSDRNLLTFHLQTRPTAKQERKDLLTAMKKTPILRVIAAYPLSAKIDRDSSKHIREALRKDTLPLATLKHEPLLAALAAYAYTPSVMPHIGVKRPLSGEDAEQSKKRGRA